MAIETKSSFGHTQSIEVCAGAPRFNRARNTDHGPEFIGDPRWLPSARPAVSVDPSPTPHRIMSLTNALAGADRMAALPSRVFSDTRATGLHRTFFLGGRSKGMDGGERFERNRLAARLINHTGSAISAGPVPCALPAAFARSEGAYKCGSPTLHRALRRARRNVLRPVRPGCRPRTFPGSPAPSPGTSRRGSPRQGTVSMSVCLNSSAVARMGTL